MLQVWRATMKVKRSKRIHYMFYVAWQCGERKSQESMMEEAVRGVAEKMTGR